MFEILYYGAPWKRTWVIHVTELAHHTRLKILFQKDYSMDDICNNKSMHEAIMADMNQLATQNKFNGLERVKKIYLHNEEFSMDNDLLTTTMKLKRQVAVKVF